MRTPQPFNPNDEFYRDLDVKRSHSSCCTCYTLSLFLVVILIITMGGLFYLYKLATKVQLFPQSAPVMAAIQTFKQKIENPKINGNQEIEIVLTDEEITAILSEGIKSGRFFIKENQIVTNSKEMVIYGVLTEPLKSQIIIKAVPKAQDGELILEIQEMKAGSLNLPSWLSDRLESSISEMIASKLELLHKNFYLEKVGTEDRQVRITGRSK